MPRQRGAHNLWPSGRLQPVGQSRDLPQLVSDSAFLRTLRQPRRVRHTWLLITHQALPVSSSTRAARSINLLVLVAHSFRKIGTRRATIFTRIKTWKNLARI